VASPLVDAFVVRAVVEREHGYQREVELAQLIGRDTFPSNLAQLTKHFDTVAITLGKAHDVPHTLIVTVPLNDAESLDTTLPSLLEIESAISASAELRNPQIKLGIAPTFEFGRNRTSEEYRVPFKELTNLFSAANGTHYLCYRDMVSLAHGWSYSRLVFAQFDSVRE
jgi:hypothetical protein